MDLGVNFVGVIPTEEDKLAYKEAKADLDAGRNIYTLEEVKKHIEDET